MAKVLFITSDYYKSNTVTSDQIGDKVLAATIADAQAMYIEPLLGTRLYEALKTKIIGGTLTGDYLTLMNDYVVITLLKWVEHDLFYMNNYKNRNKGVSTKNSENATSVSFRSVSTSTSIPPRSFADAAYPSVYKSPDCRLLINV